MIPFDSDYKAERREARLARQRRYEAAKQRRLEKVHAVLITREKTGVDILGSIVANYL